MHAAAAAQPAPSLADTKILRPLRPLPPAPAPCTDGSSFFSVDLTTGIPLTFRRFTHLHTLVIEECSVPDRVKLPLPRQLPKSLVTLKLRKSTYSGECAYCLAARAGPRCTPRTVVAVRAVPGRAPHSAAALQQHPAATPFVGS